MTGWKSRELAWRHIKGAEDPWGQPGDGFSGIRNVYREKARECVVMCVAVIDTAGEVRGLAVDPSLSDELVDEGIGAKAGEAGVSTPAIKKWRVEEPMPRGLLSVVPRQLADRVLTCQSQSS